MEAVVRNTTIQGSLSIIFVTLAITVIISSVVATVTSWRSGGGPSEEDPRVESRVFAPSGLIATAEEREIQAQWDALPAERRPIVTSGH